MLIISYATHLLLLDTDPEKDYVGAVNINVQEELEDTSTISSSQKSCKSSVSRISYSSSSSSTLISSAFT